jgi:hypothetical protein
MLQQKLHRDRLEQLVVKKVEPNNEVNSQPGKIFIHLLQQPSLIFNLNPVFF